MTEVEISQEKFYHRLGRLLENWSTQKQILWGNCDAVCIPNGPTSEDLHYSKSSAMHLYLFGLEFPDSIILVTKTDFWFMATDKKCKYVEALVGTACPVNIKVLRKTKDEGLNREHFNTLLGAVRKSGGNRIGSLFKKESEGTFIPSWMSRIDEGGLEKIEIGESLGRLLAVKDEVELDMVKRAAVLSNKVMKHGFVSEMEGIIDEERKVKQDELSSKIEGVIFDPSKIGVKVSGEVESCFSPIVESGGKYDIKVTAASNSDVMTPDVIICSLGARYKGYCASLARTFMVDAPSKIEQTYATLLSLYAACLEQMVVGNELKDVLVGAKAFLQKKDSALLGNLPKTLGFAMGLEFRDSSLVLNDKNATKFVDGMVFNLSVGFHNVPLSADDKKGAGEAAQKLDVFSLLLGDTVRIQQESLPEILTKFSKEYNDVSYSIGDDGEDGEKDREADPEGVYEDDDGGIRRSMRSREEREAAEGAAAQRAARQKELMLKRLEEAKRKLVPGAGGGGASDEAAEVEVEELSAYRSTEDYPRDVQPNRIKVDMDKEALILPINGRPVPFHMSTIKSVTRPEEGKTTWMRINFFQPPKTATMSKEMSRNMQSLMVKYGDRHVVVKEMTFRSLDSRNLVHAHTQFTELKKKIKQREMKAEQEKDIVVQAKLVRIKDQRVPRLQDVTMRPQISGRKCVGNLEAHQNGLRFVSTKAEIVDIMYDNIKHAIFQPCQQTTIVLVHFHLKDFIMIGKKKQKDVQFFTEVIDSSVNLDGARRSSYDPDELEDEQRDREMKRRINGAFKEFCQKLEKVAAHYEHRLHMEVPFAKHAFQGNCNKEMVQILPTKNCIVNLTEVPFFLLTLSDVDHVHFERVSFGTKNFDAVFIFKNFEVLPRVITAIDRKYLDLIQTWLNEIEITYTSGPKNLNWSEVMKEVVAAGEYFYIDTDENGDKKEPGWAILNVDDADEEDEDEEDEESSYGGEEEGDESDEDDSDEDDSDEYDDDEDDDDEEEEDEDEEEGMSWEEHERAAAMEDKAKRTIEGRQPAGPPKKIAKR